MWFVNLFRKSWNILRQSKLIWLFALFVILSEGFTLIQLPTNIVFRCLYPIISILGGIIHYVGVIGLILLVYRITGGETIILEEAWQAAKNNILRVFLLIFPFVIIIGLPIMAVLVANRQAWNNFWISLAIFLILTITVAVYTVALRIIVIENGGVISSIWNGILISTNNFGRVLIISLLLTAIRYTVVVLATLIVRYTQGIDALPSHLGFSISSYFALYQVPLVKYFGLIGSYFINPFQSIVVTLAYLMFVEEIKYPGIQIEKSAT